jgi:hypothetical protein
VGGGSIDQVVGWLVDWVVWSVGLFVCLLACLLGWVGCGWVGHEYWATRTDTQTHTHTHTDRQTHTWPFNHPCTPHAHTYTVSVSTHHGVLLEGSVSGVDEVEDDPQRLAARQIGLVWRDNIDELAR